MSGLFSIDYLDRAWHEETMLQTALDFAARIQPNYSGFLLFMASLLIVAIVLLAVLLAVMLLSRRQRDARVEQQPAQPVQITLHITQPTTEYLPPAGNSHMAALATRLQQEKRLLIGGGK